MSQIKALIKLELCNFLNLNVFLHNKDPKTKRKNILLGFTYLLLILMLMFYVGGMVYGYVSIGLSEIIPAYLVMISSLLIFALGIFKAGNTIFKKEGYEILCSMPITSKEIVLAKLFRLYIEDLCITLLIFIPGFSVYAILLQPEIFFYAKLIAMGICIPCLPMFLYSFIETLITGFASRMKHKSLVNTILTLLFVGVIFIFSGSISTIENDIDLEMISNLSLLILKQIQQIYPFAIYFSSCLLKNDLLKGILYIVVSLGSSFVLWILISRFYHFISTNLYTTYAKHDYKMKDLNKSSILWSLCKKEFKRYFASSVYVTNTIIGPMMGCAFAIVLLFVDMELILKEFPMAIDVNTILPILIVGMFSMMTTTAVSISMEGKNWWIIKTLPVDTKTILNAKILMNLLLNLPFFVVSEIALIFALKPDFLNNIWMLLFSALYLIFCAIFGISVNLHFVNFDYESEASVVKQSASAFIGGMGGFLLSMILCVILLVLPQNFMSIFKILSCVLLSVISYLLYKINNKTDLRKL